MKRIILSISLFLPYFALAVTQNLLQDDMKDVHKKILKTIEKHPKTLVVYDIDNTILAMKQGLGSDQWFNWKSKKISRKNPKLFGELLSWQHILYDLSAMRLTQKEIPQIIKDLQRKNLPVIALTSRNPNYREPTERELLINHVDFSVTPIGFGIPKKFIPEGHKRQVSYMNGIFMTSGQHKGKMLEFLLKKFNLEKNFTQIIFIDDSKKNVDRVFETFKTSKKSEILSIRYTKEDKNVENFEKNEKLKKSADQKLRSLRENLIQTFNRAPLLI